MDTFYLTVLKVEGLKEVSNSYLYIYLGPNIIRVLTLEAFEINSITIPKGSLRFVIEDSQTSVPQASLSFESTIFKRSGYHWLPLFTAQDKCLKEVPEEVGLPRVLIDIQANILFSVQELTEDSDTIEELPENFSMEEYTQSRGRPSSNGLEILELDESNYKEDDADQMTEVKMVQMKKLYEDAILKNNELEEVLQAKNSTVKDLIIQLNEKEKEMIKVVEKNEELMGRVGELVKENRILKSEIEKKPNLEVEKTGSLYISEHRVDFNWEDDDKERLIKKLFEAECKISAYRLKALEEIDAKVRKHLNSKQLDNIAALCSELAYKIGNKKFTVFMKSESIYCKSDGSVKKLDYFLNNHCAQDIDLYKKRKRSSANGSKHNIPTFSTLEKSNSSTAHTFFTTSKSKLSCLSTKRSVTPLRRKAYSPLERALVSR